VRPWRDFVPSERCQGCQWQREGLEAFDDADGRRFWLCDSCRPAAQAEKQRTLADRQRALEAREREAAGQMRLDGTGEACAAREGPLTLF